MTQDFERYRNTYYALKAAGKQREANELSREYLASLRAKFEGIHKPFSNSRYDRQDVV